MRRELLIYEKLRLLRWFVVHNPGGTRRGQIYTIKIETYFMERERFWM